MVFAAFGYILFKSILVCIFGHRKFQSAKLKAKYCIDSNKRPALYCRKRVLNWWCIWIFSKFVALYNQVFAQNVDFWKPKKWRTIHHQDCTVLCGPSNPFFVFGLKWAFGTPKDQIPTSYFVLKPLSASNWCVKLSILRKIYLLLEKNSVFRL